MNNNTTLDATVEKVIEAEEQAGRKEYWFQDCGFYYDIDCYVERTGQPDDEVTRWSLTIEIDNTKKIAGAYYGINLDREPNGMDETAKVPEPFQARAVADLDRFWAVLQPALIASGFDVAGITPRREV